MCTGTVLDLAVGQMFGPYRFIERYGVPGFGTLYRVFDTEAQQIRAVWPLPRIQTDPALVEQIGREAQTVARLQHPHIVQVHAVRLIDGFGLVVIEPVTGQSLAELLRREPPLAIARAVRVVTGLASALDALHASGIFHHDVTPGNVLVGPHDQSKLVDFGIERGLRRTMANTGRLIGRPEYLAPEFIRGEASGPTLDQYALGVVAYELCTGRLPFQAAMSLATIRSHVYDMPPRPRALRPELPEAVEQALLRQLAKDPSDRYPTCAAFAEALSEASSGWRSLWRRWW